MWLYLCIYTVFVNPNWFWPYVPLYPQSFPRFKTMSRVLQGSKKGPRVSQSCKKNWRGPWPYSMEMSRLASAHLRLMSSSTSSVSSSLEISPRCSSHALRAAHAATGGHVCVRTNDSRDSLGGRSRFLFGLLRPCGGREGSPRAILSHAA